MIFRKYASQLWYFLFPICFRGSIFVVTFLLTKIFLIEKTQLLILSSHLHIDKLIFLIVLMFLTAPAVLQWEFGNSLPSSHAKCIPTAFRSTTWLRISNISYPRAFYCFLNQSCKENTPWFYFTSFKVVSRWTMDYGGGWIKNQPQDKSACIFLQVSSLLFNSWWIARQYMMNTFLQNWSVKNAFPLRTSPLNIINIIAMLSWWWDGVRALFRLIIFIWYNSTGFYSTRDFLVGRTFVPPRHGQVLDESSRTMLRDSSPRTWVVDASHLGLCLNASCARASGHSSRVRPLSCR
jgi:hypothetical protein